METYHNLICLRPGWMHAGYPIMVHKSMAADLVSVEHIRSVGLWGPIHELGHNQQRACWEFPPNTTECTCNLWSVYVHEEVLGINREKVEEISCDCLIEKCGRCLSVTSSPLAPRRLIRP